MCEKQHFIARVRKNLNGPSISLRDYWSLFGGWEALIGSAYAWTALFATAFLWWFKGEMTWLSPTLSILPNLLGFTVAAYAILLAFGDEEFKKIIITYPKKRKDSFFMTVNGTFCHFIIIQCLTLVYAVLFGTLGLNAMHFQALGMWLLLYSLLLSIAVALAMLTIARTYETITRDKISVGKGSNEDILNVLIEIRDLFSGTKSSGIDPEPGLSKDERQDIHLDVGK